jgi:hypothetical protein
MGDEERSSDPLPDSFATEEEAGEFWDTHNLTDYKEHLEADDDVTFEISERVFEVQIAEDIFRATSLRNLEANIY